MTRSPLRRLLEYSRAYRGRLLAALFAMLVYAAASSGLAYLIRPIIDKVLPGESGWPFRSWASLIVGAYLLKGVGSYFSTYLMTDVGQRVVRDIRDQLFRHILDQSAAFFSRKTTGQLMSRITNDVNQVQQAVSETIGDLVREGLTAVGWVVAMFYYDWRLTLVSMTGAPIVLYPLVRLGQRVRRSTRRSQEQLEHLSHLTAEAFTGHRIVKAFGAEGQEAVRFSGASNRLYRTNLKVTSTVSLMPPIMEFLGGIAVVALLWYGQKKISGGGGMTPGSFLGFIFAAFMLYTPVKRLSRVNANLQQAIAAATRIFEILDTHSEVHERPGAREIAGLARAIEFRDVSFAYDDGAGKAVLKNVSFAARPGQVIAIVGLSGAGKTTLVNLLPRFYDVTGGAILMDGVDVRDLTLKSLRGQIGIVTQEVVLFNDTVRNNIAYGRTNVDERLVIEAAKAANAHDFISQLPQ
ncbi:MAG TPA: ABC transporter ATP-binding protein, partial [Vicinamibacterales bacterium]